MKSEKLTKKDGSVDSQQKKYKLPLVGFATCYYDFPQDDPEMVVKGSRRALKRLLEMELATARCEFDRLKGYYEELDIKGRLYLSGVAVCIIGALGRGDVKLFARILGDLKSYPRRNPHPQAKLGYEITEAWIRQLLRVGEGLPEWMVRVNLNDIPDEWKRQCAYLGVKGLLVRKEYDTAYVAATMLLNFDSRRDDLAVNPVYERLVCAFACYELGRREEAFRWLRQTAEMICPHGIILPFLVLAARLGPVMEGVIREVAPEAVPRIHRLAPEIFGNLIRFRNLFTGVELTTALTPREFYVAQQLCAKCAYKEIAAKLNISVGRVNNIVADIYAKLGVHRKEHLQKFVW